MKPSGRKNAAGDWLRAEFLDRAATAAMIFMAFAGFAMGFAIRSLPIFDFETGAFLTVATVIALFLSFGILWMYLRRIDATWVRGLRAERRVGDLIDHALLRPGCAFAHDVKEALSGTGNVDHVAMTPAGVWVVETKSGWLDKRRFPPALRQVAENVRRVRRHLDTTLPVRGALVIADRWDRSLEAEHDWTGQPVMVFAPQTFWSLLRNESDHDTGGEPSPELTRVERLVWDLGSTRHLGA